MLTTPERRPAPSLAHEAAGMTPGLTLLFAVACGAMVANIYYAQSLIGLIGPALGLRADMTGFIVTLTQLGYGAGLLLVVSLADLVENRRLILFTTAGTVVGLLGVATAASAPAFLGFSFLVGLCSVGAQVLLPLAAHFSPQATRGRVIGNVMSGLLAGIMLSRPLASFMAASFGWRAIFWVSAAIMLGVLALLWRSLPRRRPTSGLHYGQILWSTLRLQAVIPLLRRRTAYQGLVFAAFNLFWTAVPLLLTHRFGLTQRGIALFALAGAGGALAAPIAGRLADRGLTRLATGLSVLGLVVAFLVADWTAAAGMLLALCATAVVLDGAVQMSMVLSQRAIYGLPAEQRGRLNAAFMTVLFLCGAAGSALAAAIFFYGGWQMTALTGAGFGVAVLLIYATEFRRNG